MSHQFFQWAYCEDIGREDSHVKLNDERCEVVDDFGESEISVQKYIKNEMYAREISDILGEYV